MTAYQNYNEETLVAYLRMGDHAAFTEIYNRYWEPLADAAFQRLRSREEAEEAVQEVFVSLYVRREQIVLRSNLEAYLRTAIKYKIIDAYRDQQLHFNHIDNLIKESSLPPKTADEDLNIKDLISRVRKATEKLPEKCREVFMMSKFQQLSHQEIADSTGITVSTVKKHLHKAMQTLRAEFHGTHFGLILVLAFLLNK